MNPLTNRCVKKDRKIGQQILANKRKKSSVRRKSSGRRKSINTGSKVGKVMKDLNVFFRKKNGYNIPNTVKLKMETILNKWGSKNKKKLEKKLRTFRRVVF